MRNLWFSYVGRRQHICIPGLKLWKTRIWHQNLRVLDGCHTFLRHIFRPYISVHFRNLFVSHIALPVKSDIKKPCQQYIQARCSWKYESNHWKCLLLLIGRFRIEHKTFRRFPKMYSTSGFHATMLTFPVEMWQTLGQYGDKQPLESLTMWRL